MKSGQVRSACYDPLMPGEFDKTAAGRAGRSQVWLLLGCTAVGKSDVALGLAQRLGAEIVCVDSMQVYRRMDIGTAKPDRQMRSLVPYHMLDVAEPSEMFTAARFVGLADEVIAGIVARN